MEAWMSFQMQKQTQCSTFKIAICETFQGWKKISTAIILNIAGRRLYLLRRLYGYWTPNISCVSYIIMYFHSQKAL